MKTLNKKTSLILPKRYFIFRDDAKSLSNSIQKKIKREKAKTLFLDFSKAFFFSRSFSDELLNVINDFKNKKLTIKIINLKPQIEKFFWQIDKRKKEIKKEINASR